MNTTITTPEMKKEIPRFFKMGETESAIVQCPCCDKILERGSFCHTRHIAAIKAAITRRGGLKGNQTIKSRKAVKPVRKIAEPIKKIDQTLKSSLLLEWA